MKTTLIISLFLLLGESLLAQEKALAKVHYQFKHMNDSTERSKFLQDEVVVYLGTTSSYYTSYSSSRLQEQLSAQMSSPTFDGNLVIRSNSSPIKESYLIDFEGEKLRKVKKVGSSDFLLQDEFPNMDWTIYEESKDIGGYLCQKATTTFRGRDYEAWFCPEIPMAYGPWKLNGLPGLILAAKDAKGEVIFDYAGFDKADSAKEVIIDLSPSVVESTEEEVLKLEKAFKENPSAFLQAQSAGKKRDIRIITSGATEGSVTAGTRFQVSGGSSSQGAIDPTKIKSMTVNKEPGSSGSPVTNNPIELLR